MTEIPSDLLVTLICPRCGQRATVAAHLAPRLTVDEGGATLRATLRSKPVDHVCGQMRLEPDPDTAPLFADERDRRRSGER